MIVQILPPRNAFLASALPTIKFWTEREPQARWALKPCGLSVHISVIGLRASGSAGFCRSERRFHDPSAHHVA